MRCLLVAVGLLFCLTVSIVRAPAQDYDIPTLRGSDGFVPARDFACCSRWGGFYFGGQLGTGFASVDFRDSTQGLVAHMLRETALENTVQPSTWQSLGKIEKTGSSYGAFGGYNSRWESLILGLELNYSRTNLDVAAPVSVIERVTAAGGNIYDLTLTANAYLNIKDLLTLRARAGWEAGNFLPYVMLGVAAVRADVFHSATAFGFQNPPPVTSPPTPCGPPQTPTCLPFSFTESEGRNGAFLWGWSIGGGIDVMVMPHVFLRAEAEFVGLSPWWNIRPTITTGRVGLGYKF